MEGGGTLDSYSFCCPSLDHHSHTIPGSLNVQHGAQDRRHQKTHRPCLIPNPRSISNQQPDIGNYQNLQEKKANFHRLSVHGIPSLIPCVNSGSAAQPARLCLFTGDQAAQCTPRLGIGLPERLESNPHHSLHLLGFYLPDRPVSPESHSHPRQCAHDIEFLAVD